MDIRQIETSLQSSDSQVRLRGITALRAYEPDVVVPLLLECLDDAEFLVRSFVAMGLGRKRTPAAYEALLQLLQADPDPNVRAEAANSLALYGEDSLPHLIRAFREDDHWLLRRSIQAAVTDMKAYDALFEISTCAVEDEDDTVRATAISCFGFLAESHLRTDALKALLSLAEAEEWPIRAGVARALKAFSGEPAARAALIRFKEDPDHRVVGSALESLMI
ncbi:MAG: HEAT repeat domain-containing protein [Cyanobacteria bacterium P01_F01_bin.33]